MKIDVVHRAASPSLRANGTSWLITTRPAAVSRAYFVFFNYTATTEIYTLSLHDALPISAPPANALCSYWMASMKPTSVRGSATRRSEEHTSELQSRPHLVCRLLLEK